MWVWNWNGLSINPSLCMLWHAFVSITKCSIFQFSVSYGITTCYICYCLHDMYTRSLLMNQSRNKIRICVAYCLFVWTTIKNPAVVLLSAELILSRLFPFLSIHHQIRKYIICLFATCVFVWKKYNIINSNFIMVLSLGYSCSVLWCTVNALSCKSQ